MLAATASDYKNLHSISNSLVSPSSKPRIQLRIDDPFSIIVAIRAQEIDNSQIMREQGRTNQRVSVRTAQPLRLFVWRVVKLVPRREDFL